MTIMDSIRLGKNFGYMVRSLRTLPEDKHADAAKAVIDHHFDHHTYCGPWCQRKGMTAEQRKNSQRYYRNKKKDAVLYEKLSELLGRFLTPQALRDVSHGMDTNVNESFNNTVSWFAPKNKVYCSSGSLLNRVALAIGINSVGFEVFFRRLFAKLGITLTSDVSHFLRVKDRSRVNRIVALKTPKKKKQRIQQKMATLKKETLIAVKERNRRDGTYKTGMNIAEGSSAGFSEADLVAARAGKVCRHCGKKGHVRRNHRDCDMYTGPQKKGSAAPAATLDKQEAGMIDGIPLDDSDMDLNAFHDVGTWSSDEDDPTGTDIYDPNNTAII